jgi:predicted ATPase
MAPDQIEEKIFEIVNQFDRGAALIDSQEERERVAELNLIAGKRAKASTAYAAALNYLDLFCFPDFFRTLPDVPFPGIPAMESINAI